MVHHSRAYVIFFARNMTCEYAFHLMLMQVKDIFLPWYNAYRFLVQNAKRLELDGHEPFKPIDHQTLENSSNVLDKWMYSATESLVRFVRQEMEAYRLDTVEFSIL